MKDGQVVKYEEVRDREFVRSDGEVKDEEMKDGDEGVPEEHLMHVNPPHHHTWAKTCGFEVVPLHLPCKTKIPELCLGKLNESQKGSNKN